MKVVATPQESKDKGDQDSLSSELLTVRDKPQKKKKPPVVAKSKSTSSRRSETVST
eukprot:CAMPEP_0172460644 /NCGR_PEP_ID=MMETSP1065-20121228/37701_1 /TAXON_ID=265537 /ORGANISM="Amphiprora paludosa, Strain CCMP125" /LENGTH=55 /DNA_ID=CAMNT_0013215741 /DNA_START=11 /DNA_END=174 /DNA_ORIENTATION=-